MTIERISFPDGIKFENNPHQQLLRLIHEHEELVVPLAEGDFDLTPSWWTKHLHTHRLTVLADGTGLYRPVPRDRDVGLGDWKTKEFKKGGTVIRIPGDQGLVMVGGPLKSLKDLGLYEIIFYVPGPNPVQPIRK